MKLCVPVWSVVRSWSPRQVFCVLKGQPLEGVYNRPVGSPTAHDGSSGSFTAPVGKGDGPYSSI